MKAIPASTLSLCEALFALAEATWDEIEQGVRTGQRLDEESITSYNLMRLVAATPSVVAEKHTRPREARSGADWEIWVGRPGAYVGFRVQAKLLRHESMTYPALYRSLSRATAQADKLISQAVAETFRGRIALYPLYCFYNWWPPSEAVQLLHSCAATAAAPRLTGWTVAGARSVVRSLSAVPSNRVRDLCQLMIPISCLFCDANGSGEVTRSLAAQVATAAESVANEGALVDRVPIHEVAPVYIERMFKGESAEQGWRIPGLPASMFRTEINSRRVPSQLSRVVLVRDLG